MCIYIYNNKLLLSLLFVCARLPEDVPGVELRALGAHPDAPVVASYIYIYIYNCMCVYIYIYIYIYL